MKIPSKILLGLTVLILANSCCMFQNTETNDSNASKMALPGPKVIIYKTKKDYSQNVPILMSKDKKSVVSYPDKKDLTIDGKLVLPTVLSKGYLLDNRGISADVAFLKLTYQEYIALPKTPNSEELLPLILDKNPLKSMYMCGLKSKFNKIEEELNEKINSNDFSTFVKIK